MTPSEFKESRKTLRLSQTTWAEALGIKREHVSKLERGQAPVSATLALLVQMYREKGLPQLTKEPNQSKSK
jgi:DNA-binding transcriptional regulator YiaG